MPTVTIPQAFALAFQHHQAGRLAEAETIYRQVLAAQPHHAPALHHLGVIARQVGRDDLAVELIGQSLVFAPDNSAAHSNLGNALSKQGRLDEAIAAYRRALELNPDLAEAHYNLGNVLSERGLFDEAIAAYRRALELKPDSVEAHNNLGNALRHRGRLDEAIATFRRVVAHKPDLAEAHGNLGNALRERGLFAEAIATYRQALALKPDDAETHSNLGDALRERGLLGEAVAAQRRAIELKPGSAEAHNRLGAALAEQDQHDEAVIAYRRALELDPGSAETYNNLGAALTKQGEPDEAVAAYRHAIQLKPDLAEAYNNLGSTLKDQGLLNEAADAYRRVTQIEPDHAWAHSNLAYLLHFQPEQDAQTIAEEHRRWNRQFAEPWKASIQPHSNDRNADRRLRIGYVSPEFRDHVTGRYLMPLFRCHDHRRFEIFCYAGVVKPDSFTEEFRRCADHWFSTVGVSDELLADRIRQDGVDILVDLTQHLAGNRLPVFARQPAPVQVSFAGYPESTGVEAIAYRISDRHLEEGYPRPSSPSSPCGPPCPSTPPGRTERVLLIDSFWCYDPCGEGLEVNSSPARENGMVTFGCLNNFCKINEPGLKLWARILAEVRDSRLLLLSSVGSHRRHTQEVFKNADIDPQRVEFLVPRGRRAYLELYHQIDIALDPFPYNGHTTSLDALWMGLPVVSLAGRRAVSRGGFSQLSNLGLPELATNSEDDYVAMATRLAGDLSRLADLRRTLRARMEASPLMDAPQFAGHIEAAYRTMWQQWCAGHPSLPR